jgi:oligoendopeptidase F
MSRDIETAKGATPGLNTVVGQRATLLDDLSKLWASLDSSDPNSLERVKNQLASVIRALRGEASSADTATTDVSVHCQDIGGTVLGDSKVSFTLPQGSSVLNEAAAVLPAWDNSKEFSGLGGEDVKKTRAQLDVLLKDIRLSLGEFEAALPDEPTKDELRPLIAPAQRLFRLLLETSVLASDLGTFAQIEVSVDGSNQQARRLSSDIQQFRADVEQAAVVLRHFEILLPTDLLSEYLRDAEVSTAEFSIVLARAHDGDTRLPIREEKLIAALSVDGFNAWADQYDNIAATATCEVMLPSGKETLGLATAGGLLQSPEPIIRRSAWSAIQQTWRSHEEATASGLNAMIGWRQELLRRRSHTRTLHYLDAPLFQNRISRRTLDTLMETLRECRSVGQRVLRAQAKALGLAALHPSDLAAPVPTKLSGDKNSSIPFSQAIESIKAAFGDVDPEMADFVATMISQRWIEARVLPRKRPGAYCTGFIRSSTPRVFMTYQDGMRDVKTLAHELGHALHEWLVRDLPVSQRSYPMTLAETASNFGEMVVEDYLEGVAASPSDVAAGLWQSMQDGSAYLINMPSRFDLECAMNDRRAQGVCTPDDLRAMTEASWKQWYGDSLTELDPMFWASKLHFHISGLSFYNFPYSFGYLFSLGVYAQREHLGKNFYQSYCSLLRDTGRMTAEDVALRHLGVDLTRPEFWQQSVAVFEKRVCQFEKLIASISA